MPPIVDKYFYEKSSSIVYFNQNIISEYDKQLYMNYFLMYF